MAPHAGRHPSAATRLSPVAARRPLIATRRQFGTNTIAKRQMAIAEMSQIVFSRNGGG